MRKAKHVDRQQPLAFGLAEGTYEERRHRLRGAIDRLRAKGSKMIDLHLKDFVFWVFNVTAGGLPSSQLVKSYDQLAATDGLCCSVPKARSTVNHARYLRLVRVHDRYAAGSQLANGYTIDWDGVAAIHGVLAPTIPGVRKEGGGGDPPGVVFLIYPTV